MVKSQELSEILKIAEALINFPSSADNHTARERCSLYARDYLAENDIPVKYIPGALEPTRGSILAGVQNPEVLLLGHLDVVEAKPDQFFPTISGTRLYGRGSCDMKAADAVFLQLLKASKKQKNWPSLGLALSTDEEIGGANGVEYLVNTLGLRPNFVITGEPTQLDIATKEKGVLQYKVTSLGRAAHASRPYLGKNALDTLMKGLNELRERFNKVSEANFWTTSFNLGVVKLGKEINKVPDFAEAWVDLRYTSPEEKSQIELAVQKTFDSSEKVLDVAMLQTNPNNPFVKALLKARKEVLNYEPKADHSFVYSDGRFFSQVGIPVVSFGPIGANAHGPQEWVDIPSLIDYKSILEEFLNNVRR